MRKFVLVSLRCRTIPPLQNLAFLHPAFVPNATGSAAPMQTGCPGLTHNPSFTALLIGDDAHECTLCLECYHGMTLRDTLCARCHNDVCSPFSLVRALTDIHMQTVHRMANTATTPQPTPTLARSRQNSTASSTASRRQRTYFTASPHLASSYG